MIGYPLVLVGLAEARCIVVGGGAVAARKVHALIEGGGQPVIISPKLCPELEHRVTSGEATVLRRAYREGDAEGATLVIAAASDSVANERVAQECHRRGILVNVVDAPEFCTFTAPAVLRRKDLLITVSTGGRSPAFSRFMRETLEGTIDDSYGDMLAILAGLRPVIRNQVPRPQQRALWDRLLDGTVMRCLREQGVEAARALADQMVSDGIAPRDDQAEA